jgi:hypothetical protein
MRILKDYIEDKYKHTCIYEGDVNIIEREYFNLLYNYNFKVYNNQMGNTNSLLMTKFIFNNKKLKAELYLSWNDVYSINIEFKDYSYHPIVTSFKELNHINNILNKHLKQEVRKIKLYSICEL